VQRHCDDDRSAANKEDLSVLLFRHNIKKKQASSKMSATNEDFGDIVQAPNGEMYLIRGFTDDMKGIKIPDELVIRAQNSRYWDRRNEEEMKQLKKSTGRCPTYGNCNRCSGSGLVGMYCQVCKDPNYGYNVMFYDGQRYIIDAEWFSRFMGATHMEAFADRRTNDTLRGRSTASTSLSDVQLSLRLERKYNEMIRRDKRLFRDGIENDTNGDWDKVENEVHILDMNGERYAGEN